MRQKRKDCFMKLKYVMEITVVKCQNCRVINHFDILIKSLLCPRRLYITADAWREIGDLFARG